MIVAGMISSASADGIEVAVVDISGAPPRLAWRLLKHTHVDLGPALRDEIFAAFRPETGTVDRLCALNFRLGQAFADAALAGIAAADLTPQDVDLIGSHGQTVWPIPDGPDASTLQLGEAAVIAEHTGITTISNFRARDMAAGGQGAPLVAYPDVLLLTDPARSRAALNLGGIANFTYLPPAQERAKAGSKEPFAFDTGPGNMLIDYAAGRATRGELSYDRDGKLAATGKIHQRLLDEVLAHPYFAQPPPKTTGRELFGVQYGSKVWERGVALGLRPEDIVATVTALTANSIAGAYRRFLPAWPEQTIVSGGGAANPTLMWWLAEALAPSEIISSERRGLPADAKEATAFAVLAYETWAGRAGNLPAATGARGQVVLGNITPGRPRLSAEGGSQDTTTGSIPASLTEARNPASMHVDTLPARDIVALMNLEDKRVVEAVEEELPAIAQAIDKIVGRMRQGGRLIYAGAGTSGRLAVLDAAECPPTFSTPPGLVVGLMAGGQEALTGAVEGAEDSAEAGRTDVAGLACRAEDTVVGVAASGRTPYVLGAMEEAKQRGALVIGLACNRPSPVGDLADVSIAPLVGPEVVTGSTRLKAGTAQKMVLNMLSTATMIRLGKTYGNLMVDVQATNAKLRARARRIVAEALEVDEVRAAELLELAGGEVKVAIVSGLTGASPDEARARLRDAGGVVRAALE
ncbi:MAG: anhydro-N-acetylmuramic acid kinase [Nitrososphaerales archaeon]